MRNIETLIEINATADKVWSELTNFEAYSEWNPFIIRASGDAQVGEILDLTMKNGKKEMGFTPQVQISQADQEFQWLGKGLGGLFKGQHYFRLSENEGKTQLIHGENFSGLLAPMIFNMVKDETRGGFEAMNEALKQRIENS